ncbi:MAG: hypothetical protein GY765_23390 [bacterium]|nr:hypothetical protein [bacterium]
MSKKVNGPKIPRTDKKGVAREPMDTDKFKTQELSLEDVEKRIKLEKMRKIAENQSEAGETQPIQLPPDQAGATGMMKREEGGSTNQMKMWNGEQPPGEPSSQQSAQTRMLNRDEIPADAGTRPKNMPGTQNPQQAVSGAPETIVMKEEDIVNSEDDGAMKVTADDYSTIVVNRANIPHREAERSSSNSGSRVLLVVVVILLGTLLYFMLSPTGDTPSGETTGGTAIAQPEETGQAPSTSTPPPVRTSRKAEKKPVVKLPDNAFLSFVPFTVKEGGAVISEELDPEIAAIGKALKIRVATIYGSKVTSSKGTVTTVTSRLFLGFRVVATHQVKKDEVTRDEIVVTTPSKGRISIKDNILDSVKKLEYDGLIAELQAIGIDVSKETQQEDGTISVQLYFSKYNDAKVSSQYLISGNQVGNVKLGMPLPDFKAALPQSQFTVIEKKILHNESFHDTFKVNDSKGRPLMFITSKSGRVGGIKILSDKFKTAKGIGIGNSLGTIRVFYQGDSPIRISTSESGVPFTSIDSVGGQFYFQAKGVDFKKRVFPNATKINAILVGSSPFVN